MSGTLMAQDWTQKFVNFPEKFIVDFSHSVLQREYKQRKVRRRSCNCGTVGQNYNSHKGKSSFMSILLDEWKSAEKIQINLSNQNFRS